MGYKRYLRRFPSLVVAAAGLACGSKPERPTEAPGASSAGAPIEIRTDRTAYRAGDTLELTVINRGRTGLAFNPCTRTLERERDGGWEPLAEPDRVCTMEAWLLGPNETRVGRTELPPEIPTGRYRVLLAFTVDGGTDGGRLTARSGPVTVQR